MRGAFPGEREREGAIGDTLLAGHLLVAHEEEPEDLPKVAELRKLFRAHLMETAFVECRGEGAGEPGTGGDLRERTESFLARGQVEEPGRDRFLRQAARRGHALAGERGKSEPVGERVQRCPPESEERPSFRSELPEKMIRGLERGRDQENGAVAFGLREP